MTEPLKRKYYRPDEVAAILRVSLRTIYNRIQDGSLPAVQVGAVYRIPVEALQKLTKVTLE